MRTHADLFEVLEQVRVDKATSTLVERRIHRDNVTLRDHVL